jgi:hypothetical protein
MKAIPRCKSVDLFTSFSKWQGEGEGVEGETN